MTHHVWVGLPSDTISGGESNTMKIPGSEGEKNDRKPLTSCLAAKSTLREEMPNF